MSVSFYIVILHVILWHNAMAPDVVCTKFDFGGGSVPDPAGGAHSAHQTS